MRIIAGRYRRLPLVAPKGLGTRPTTDRVREALFQHLESARFSFDGVRVLDLFAGSGALGLEALSRGARVLVSVEKDRAALGALRTNVARLKAEAEVQVIGAALPRALRRIDGPFDVVFADPPYEVAVACVSELASDVAERCCPGAWWIVEHARADALPELERWQSVDVRAYGDTGVSLLRLDEGSGAASE